MADEERGNVARSCGVCGQIDDHPRHIVYDAIPDPRNPGKFIDLTEVRHMDCCASAGCEHDGSCKRIMDHVKAHGTKSKFVSGEQRLKGDDLRAHIIKHGDELAELHTAAAEQQFRADHGDERTDRYLSGGPLYSDGEVAQLAAAGARHWRHLQEGSNR